jgi:DNA invertase Pin-like site-specific DNA recombinase
MREKNVRVISVNDGFDSTYNGNGLNIIELLGERINQEYKKIMSGKIKAGIAAKRAQEANK